MSDEWKRVDGIAAELRDRFGAATDVCIVLGSGLGAVADGLSDRQTVETREIADWPTSTVAGHRGSVQVGMVGSVRVLLLQGRVHLYEGYSPAEVVRPVRSAITWGVGTVVLTNAAGAVDKNLVPGQLMVFEDHLNLTGQNPLVGANSDDRGPRFPDLTALYSAELRTSAAECAARLGIDLATGVYAGVLGPSYETPAEVRMLFAAGASAVGMSTVHEAIAARHLSARVAAFSCITNRAAGLEGAVLDHDHVQRAGQTASEDLTGLLSALISTLKDEQ